MKITQNIKELKEEIDEYRANVTDIQKKWNVSKSKMIRQRHLKEQAMKEEHESRQRAIFFERVMNEYKGKCKGYKEKLLELYQDNELLDRENDELKDKLTQVIQERDEFKAEKELLERQVFELKMRLNHRPIGHGFGGTRRRFGDRGIFGGRRGEINVGGNGGSGDEGRAEVDGPPQKKQRLNW